MDLAAVVEQAKRIATSTADTANVALQGDDFKEAKRLVVAGQRELRELKRNVTNAEREMRAGFQQERIDVNKQGQFIGALGGSKMRGAMSRSRAASKRQLAQRQANQSDAYRQVKAVIDDLVSQLDGAKFSIDSEAARQKDARSSQTTTRAKSSPSADRSASAVPAPPPPPPTPATWAPDPHGRHQLRYWDGQAWTEHVSQRCAGSRPGRREPTSVANRWPVRHPS